MKKFRSFFLAILFMGVLTSPVWAEGDHGHDDWRGPIFYDIRHGHGNGPVNANDRPGRAFNLFLASGQADAGQIDPNVTVIPPGGSSQAAIVCANIPGAWASPLAHSNWISLQADCTTSLANAANYQYSTTFTLPAHHPGVSIAGNVLADDSVTIQLNGNTIFTGGGFTSPTPFSSNNPAFFTTGTNTLTFTVYNVTGPSGLDFAARVHAGRGQPPGPPRGDQDDNDNDGD